MTSEPQAEHAPHEGQLYQERPLADGRSAYEKAAPGIKELIVAAIAEVPPQVLLAIDEVPLDRVEELLAAIQGPAVRAVLEARIEQIVVRGHTAESDAMLAVGHLPKQARDFAQMALENINGTAERRDFAVARRRLAKAAALCLAAIDRLDMVKGGAEL